MEKISYDLGIDLGTTSVGFSAVDENGEVLKRKGKKIIGVRLFDEASTAEARRLARGTRRRYIRRKNRIKYLRELIGKEVIKYDKEFFTKLNESFLHECDREVKNENKGNIFTDVNFNDKDYYKKYPTVFHLRKHLMNTKDKEDIRLVYLAIHHTIKYRGNFLYEGDFDTSKGLIQCIDDLFLRVQTLFTKETYEDIDNIKEKYIDILENEKINNKFKESELKKLIKINNKTEKSIYENIIKAILGYKMDFSKLFNMQIETTNKSFKEEINEDEVKGLIGDDNYIIYDDLFKIYSMLSLNEILKNCSYISEAMCRSYRKYGDDLKLLKDVYKSYTDKYYAMFKEGFYATNYKNEKNVLYNKIKVDLGIKKLKKDEMENLSNVLKYIYDEINNNNFLVRQNTTDNVIIPHQLHLKELEKIIDNQGEHYEVLKNNKEKIISILKFKLPYYVGPLNSNKKNNQVFAWSERIEKGEIKPWNFKHKINIDKSAEDFINRMRNKCTYLINEDTLPKNSLINMEFNLLNELNKITINHKLISSDLKVSVINDLFKKRKKVTKTALKKYLIEQHNFDKEIYIKGFQSEDGFASSLSSYIDFTNILNEIIENNKEMIENIILWLTIFNDKEIIERKIIANYEEELSREEVSKIVKLKYNGWSRISRKLIDGIQTQNFETILDIMRKSNKNFMQVVNYDDIKEKIKKESVVETSGKITMEHINKLYGSPALKRGIYQTVKIIEEIIKVVGNEPKNIYIEFARHEDKKVRVPNRVKTLQKAYLNLEKLTDEYNKTLQNKLAKAKDNKDLGLNSEMMYLYYIQNGKCMYTGKSITEEDLSTRCHIDHILPQCYVKDDSLENKALVLSTENTRKSDSLLLTNDVIDLRKAWWNNLYKSNLIGAKKYRNLIRKNINDDDIEKFTARQLVETRQMSKHIATLLSEHYSNNKINTEVKIIRANLVSNFRKKYDLYKIRELNEYHHAFDAYLTSVVGKMIEIKYPKLEKTLKYDDYIKFKQKSKMNYGYVVDSLEKEKVDKHGEIIWSKEIFDNYLKTITKVLNYKNILVTKKKEVAIGDFYNINPVSKEKARIQLKQGLDIKKYGGYTGENPQYYVAIQFEDKKKIKSTLIGIPRQKVSSIGRDDDKLLHYITEEVGYKNVKIIKKISKFQKIIFDGHLYYLASVSKRGAELYNAKNLIVNDKKIEKIIYAITHKEAKSKHSKNKLYEEYTYEDVKSVFDYLLNKLENEYKIFKNEIEKIKTYKKNEDNEDKEEKEILSKIILSMLQIMSIKSTQLDFKAYKDNLSNTASDMGRIRGKRLSLEKIVFIDESVTGLHERKVSYEFSNGSYNIKK